MFMDGLPCIQLLPADGAQTGALLYRVNASGEASQVLAAGSNGDFELIGRLR
jgi:hypothetical protein